MLSAEPNRRLGGFALALALLALAVMPAGAQAAPSMSAAVTFPTPANVGVTYPASVTFVNTGDINIDPLLTFCNAGDPGVCAGAAGIVVTPSCGSPVGPPCSLPNADPDVFAVSPTATGRAGTACAGMTLFAADADPTLGSVRFTPAGGAHVVLGMGAGCILDFSVTVLRFPTLDATAMPGLQTVPNVVASARSSLGVLVAGGGTTTVTLLAGVPPAMPSVTSTDPASPANNNTPRVKGLAAAGSVVGLYTNAACTGAPAAQGNAAAFGSPGIPVAVADNSTTTFYAKATYPITGLSSPCSTTSRTYAEQTPPPPPPDVVSFAASKKSLRVSKTGRFTYAFVATPSRSGKLGLKSTKKVKFGTKKKFMKLTAKAFTASPTGKAQVKFKLSKSNLRSLKRSRTRKFVVTATLNGKTFTGKLTLKAPKKT